MTEELKDKFRPHCGQYLIKYGEKGNEVAVAKLDPREAREKNTNAAVLVALEFALELFRDKNRSSTGTMIELKQQIERLKGGNTTEKKPCPHPIDQRVNYHDESIKCNACECIIEQHGEKIEPPTEL